MEPKVEVAIDEMLATVVWTPDSLVSSEIEDTIALSILGSNTIGTLQDMPDEVYDQSAC